VKRFYIYNFKVKYGLAGAVARSKIVLIFQCPSDVHALNILLDVHIMNGLNPQIEGPDGSPAGNGT
jgi:hypothetical protein